MADRSVDIPRSLTYMFEEEEWGTKFLIAVGMSVLSFLVLPALILQGYLLDILRNVSAGRDRVLPEWDNWGYLLVRGLLSSIAGFVYMLPLVTIFCCGFIGLAAVSNPDTGEAGGLFVLFFCCILGVVLLLQIPLLVMYMVGTVRYAESNDFGAYFEFSRLFQTVRNESGSVGLAALLIFAFQAVGQVVPFIGYAWAGLASAHIAGQILGHGGQDTLDPDEEPLAI